MWHRGLKLQCCHCSSLGCCCGVGLIPGPGTSICGGCGQKKKKRKKEKKEIVKIPFTVASKIIKFLRINQEIERLIQRKLQNILERI